MKSFNATGAKRGKAAGPRAFHGLFNELLEHNSKIRSALWWAGNRRDSIWKTGWRQPSEISQFCSTQRKSLKAPNGSFWLRHRQGKETHCLKKKISLSQRKRLQLYKSSVEEATKPAKAPEIQPEFLFEVCFKSVCELINQQFMSQPSELIDSKRELLLFVLLVCLSVYKWIHILTAQTRTEKRP